MPAVGPYREDSGHPADAIRNTSLIQNRQHSDLRYLLPPQLRCEPSGQIMHEAKMAVTDLIIRDIKVRAVVAPLKRPVRTAVGTIPSAPLVLIDVLTSDGSVGRSYIFAYTAAALVPLARLVSEIAEELKGKSIAPALRMREFDRRFRLVGWQGLIGMAVSGLDMAFWDAIARTLDQPIAALLKCSPAAVLDLIKDG